MTRILPVIFKWDVDANVMRPDPRYAKIIARQFTDGEEYPLIVIETRSRASHNHYFAALQAAYNTLPEGVAARWDNADHFRKWCLIEEGWYDEQEHEFDTARDAKQFALRLAAFAKRNDAYVRIWPAGKKVIVRTAKSQSAHAMGKQAFEDSKKAVLLRAAEFIGVKPKQLETEGRHARA